MSEQPKTPSAHVSSKDPPSVSQPGMRFGSQRLSSLGVSTQSQSPHPTYATWDTAKSRRSTGSIPASEIQWLLQAMGSAVAATDRVPLTSASTVHAHPRDLASPAALADELIGRGEAAVADASGTLGQRSEREPSAPVPCATPAGATKVETSTPPHGIQVPVEHVLAWDSEKQAASDRRCEDLLMTILQETSKVDADVKV